MSADYKGPDKIYIESPTNQRTLPDSHRRFNKHNVEYIRADLVIIKPDHCEKCGDCGVYMAFSDGFNHAHTCPCTKEPSSLYNVVRELRKQ